MTDELVTQIRVGDPNFRGPLAAWRRPEPQFSLVRALTALCPAYKPARHQPSL
jgi:hypothetical protein